MVNRHLLPPIGTPWGLLVVKILCNHVWHYVGQSNERRIGASRGSHDPLDQTMGPSPGTAGACCVIFGFISAVAGGWQFLFVHQVGGSLRPGMTRCTCAKMRIHWRQELS